MLRIYRAFGVIFSSGGRDQESDGKVAEHLILFGREDDVHSRCPKGKQSLAEICDRKMPAHTS
jgi:hypothetical protein